MLHTVIQYSYWTYIKILFWYRFVLHYITVWDNGEYYSLWLPEVMLSGQHQGSVQTQPHILSIESSSPKTKIHTKTKTNTNTKTKCYLVSTKARFRHSLIFYQLNHLNTTDPKSFVRLKEKNGAIINLHVIPHRFVSDPP